MKTDEKEIYHVPVLTDKIIEYVIIDKVGIYLDGTAGGGGHSEAVLKILSQNGTLIGVDLDQDAVNYTNNRLQNFDNKLIFRENFFNLEKIIKKASVKKFNGIILDLGISSYQISEAARGFTFMYDSPLDMRMSKGSGLTAAEILNQYDKDRLADIFFHYGEEKKSRKIAGMITKLRTTDKFKTSGQVVEIIQKAVPKSKWIKSAARIFQALRIEVNRELENLKNFLNIFPDYLAPGGRLAVLSYHSLEDRLVKDYFRKYTGVCICPKDFPVCRCSSIKMINIITKKPILPDEKEIKRNPRSRSAKLRVAERISS